jgi:two-component sensor histidine kinase
MRSLLLSLACCVLLGLFFSGRNILGYLAIGLPIQWDRAFFYEMTYWLAWAPLMPLAIQFAVRFRIERNRLLNALGAHAALGFVLSVLQVLLTYVVHVATLPFVASLPKDQVLERFLAMRPYMIYTLPISFWMYWVLIGVYYAFDYYSLYREQKLQALRAQLDVLKAQLNPHFLFNTLNSISVLIAQDPSKANHMLLRLSELLRVALESEGKHEVALATELAVLKQYLEIEQIRFGDRLRVSFDVEPQVMEMYVPSLLLQPLVENAVHHAIAPRAKGGQVTVRAFQNNGALRLEIGDDGPGLSEAVASNRARAGMGIANSRERLVRLYGDQQRFELIHPKDGGLVVSITIPLRRAAELGQETSRLP